MAVTLSALFPLPLLFGNKRHDFAALQAVLAVVESSQEMRAFFYRIYGQKKKILPPQVNKETTADTSTVTSSCLHVGDFQFGMEAWHLRCLLQAS